jgi:hypothetical protein
MQRRRVAEGGPVLEDGNPIRSVPGRDADGHPSVEEP